MTDRNFSKKRILFILPSLNSGGAERVLITLMNGLDREKFDPQFLTISSSGELRSLIAPDIPFTSLGGSKVLKALPALFFCLKKLSPEIVVTTMAHLNIVTLFLKPFFPRTRFIVREAIVPSFFFETQKRAWLVKILYRIFYPLADVVISPAQKIIDEFQTLVGLRRVVHILLHNPVNLEKIRGDWPLPPRRADTVQFVCAGRLHPQKGFDRLIAALPRLNHPYPWHLTILGKGPEQENLQRLINSLALENRVTLAGLSETPWPMMGSADAFLLPSRFEGLPNVVLESLAVGTPVIATRDSGGIEEIAALATPEAVCVVEGMDDFLEAMRQVRPADISALRPSLLPEAFHPQSVNRRFEEILCAGRDTRRLS